jgi:hypothetical protein
VRKDKIWDRKGMKESGCENEKGKEVCIEKINKKKYLLR